MNRYIIGLMTSFATLAATAASAREYYIGGPVNKYDLEVVANYLIGVEMAPMAPDMPHGADVIHVEADIHATADNRNGFPDGAWIPNLPIAYTIEKTGSSWKATGTLKAMLAKDGPHYADDVKMDGPGDYRLTYDIGTPGMQGFLRHVDKETGVPDWWPPFSEVFTFKYPQAQ